MDMDEKREPPVIDLHESEWRRDGKHEPILGPNGKYFLIMIPVAIVCFLVSRTIVEALWPLIWPH